METPAPCCTLTEVNSSNSARPTVNPLLSIEEAGFIQSACGLLCYYSETELARVVDLILQLPLPDEDLIASLLCWNGLDTEFTPSKTPYGSNKTPTTSLVTSRINKTNFIISMAMLTWYCCHTSHALFFRLCM